MDRGVFRKLDPRIAALSILGMVGQYLQGIHVYSLDEFERIPNDRMVETVVEIALGGLLLKSFRGPPFGSSSELRRNETRIRSS